MHTMVDYLQRPVKHDYFYKKYAAKKFLKGQHSIQCSCWMHLLTSIQPPFMPEPGPRNTLVASQPPRLQSALDSNSSRWSCHLHASLFWRSGVRRTHMRSHAADCDKLAAISRTSWVCIQLLMLSLHCIVEL